MAAKVINFHSPDGKNTYELTFTRDSCLLYTSPSPRD